MIGEANPLLAAALDYAARGWRVVPLHECVSRGPGVAIGCSCGRDGCDSQGKHPRIKEWQKVASSDPAQIDQWWHKWPGANVGVALGPASGLVAIDVDTEAGTALLIRLAGDADREPTAAFVTGKGYRLLFSIPSGLKIAPATRAVQIDGTEAVRYQSTGGQCVMPPSLHPSGKRYAWCADRSPDACAVLPMPAWLIAEMCRPKSPTWSDQGARDAHLEGRDFNRAADWARDILLPAGFKPAGEVDGVLRFTRPGKDSGISVTVGHYSATDGTPALYVFSGSIPGLEAERCYDKFGAYAKLLHGGDFTAAASAIRAAGFDPRKGKARPVEVKIVPPAKPVEWSQPIDLDDPSVGAVPYPAHVLPDALADLCYSSADSVGCPVDYGATHALAVAAGAIGGAYDLQIKRGFTVPSVIWACVVAPPGSGKSPAVAPILAPVYEQQRALRAVGNDKPIYVSDVTVERLARLLESDQRGLTMIWDEMAGWLTSFNQYKAKGAGNDRTHYLSIWDGRAVKVDRAGPDKPPIFVQRPRLSVVGGIQPEVLDMLRSGPSDGLFDRILFSYPADPGLTVETFVEPEEAAAHLWCEALKKLWARMPRRDADGDRPCIVTLNDDARPVWQEWTRELATAAACVDAPEYYRSVAAKLQGYAARLALVLKLLHEAYAEVQGGSWEQGIGETDMARGVAVARYHLDHAGRVRRMGGRDRRLVRAKAIRRWLSGRTSGSVSRSEIWQTMRRNSAFAAPEDLEGPLALLVLHRVLRPAGGAYEVNPAIVMEPDAANEAKATV